MVVLEVVFSIVFSNLIELVLHKYVLHGLGKKKQSRFSHHWHSHHYNARRYNFFDPEYNVSMFKWGPRSKEILSILFLLLVLLPVFWLSKTVYLTFLVYSLVYLYMHRWMHKNPELSKKYFKHHYTHHMGKNQDSNWCVLFPLWDLILRTRKYE